MADDFLGGPLARDRPGEQLVPRYPGDGTSQQAGSGKVFRNQCLVVHGVILTGGLISMLLGMTGCSEGCFVLRGMAVIHSSFSCPHTPQFVVHGFLIESLRVEFATHPFQQFFVPAMVRVV